MVLSEDQGNFKFGKTELPDEAKAEIDQIVTQLKADPKGAWFEIEGHTDNVGGQDYNERLGIERAEAVKRYLYEQHQVPLHKMNVISYGEDKPVAPNNTKRRPRAEPPRRHPRPYLNRTINARTECPRRQICGGAAFGTGIERGIGGRAHQCAVMGWRHADNNSTFAGCSRPVPGCSFFPSPRPQAPDKVQRPSLR